MVQRCTNPKTRDFPNYGVRGITVCSEWRKFEAFYRDMGVRPAGMTLDGRLSVGLWLRSLTATIH